MIILAIGMTCLGEVVIMVIIRRIMMVIIRMLSLIMALMNLVLALLLQMQGIRLIVKG